MTVRPKDYVKPSAAASLNRQSNIGGRFFLAHWNFGCLCAVLKLICKEKANNFNDTCIDKSGCVRKSCAETWEPEGALLQVIGLGRAVSVGAVSVCFIER